MEENRAQDKNTPEEEQQRPPELAGQLAFDGANITEIKQQSEQEQRPPVIINAKVQKTKQQSEQPQGLKLILKDNGQIIGPDGNDIQSNPEALANYYSILNYQYDGKLKDLAALLIERLPKATAAEVINKAQQKATAAGIEAGKIISRAESIKSYLIKELKKDIYHGETLESLIYNNPEALADPDDKRTKLLLKAIAAVERAAHQPHEKIKAADRKRAAEAGAVNYQPKSIITITNKDYKSGFSFTAAGSAALAVLPEEEYTNIKITEDGRLYYPKIGALSELEIENTLTHEQILSIDLPLLRLFYTYIVKEAEAARKSGNIQPLDGKLIIDASTLAAELGESRPTSTRAKNKAISAAKSFHNIAGKLVHDQHATQSYYQVLNFEKYDSKNNTITLRAPYLAYLFQEVEKNSMKAPAAEIEKEKGRELSNDKSSALLTSKKAFHGYGINQELYKKYRRNKVVLENLFILDEVIEPGGRRPNIRACELINRNIYFKDLLKGKDTRATNRTLKRIFTQTWQGLRSSALAKMYNKIELPDPNNPADIPTIETLNKCFYFNNTGKKKHPPIFQDVNQPPQQTKNEKAIKQLNALRAQKEKLVKDPTANKEEIENIELNIKSIEDSIKYNTPQAPKK